MTSEWGIKSRANLPRTRGMVSKTWRDIGVMIAIIAYLSEVTLMKSIHCNPVNLAMTEFIGSYRRECSHLVRISNHSVENMLTSVKYSTDTNTSAWKNCLKMSRRIGWVLYVNDFVAMNIRTNQTSNLSSASYILLVSTPITHLRTLCRLWVR